MEAEGVDWQNTCRDVRSRGQYILEFDKWTDCRFLVGSEPNQQILSGHKLILAMASPVFERMFYGNLNDKNDPILIPDVQPDAFRAMMEYIYSDKINIESFDKACELCYVAKKYILPHVVAQCTQYLWSDLRPKNVCRAYEFAKLFEEPRLMQRCLQIIASKTQDVLGDPSFSDIEVSTLLTIFDQDKLSIDSELDLFNALKKYADDRGFFGTAGSSAKSTPENSREPSEAKQEIEQMQECLEEMQNVDDDSNSNAGEGQSSQNLQPLPPPESAVVEEILIKEAIKKIRFLTLTPQQFAEGPARSRLLSQEEALAILINISSPSINDCPMPEGFSGSRIRRNSLSRCEEAHSSRYADVMPIFNEHAYTVSVPHQHAVLRAPNLDTTAMVGPVYGDYFPTTSDHELVVPTMETRKFYCGRTIRQQIDYRNTSVTDCSLTFRVDKNILITGVQVPTQVLCGEMMSSENFTDRYSEILYAHLLDAQGSRLTYTHCTSRVRYDSLLEISFDRPVFLCQHKMYKIGVVFNKVGWYPMYTCFPEVTCDGVRFVFNIGAPHESLRDGLIRAIVFTHPSEPTTYSGVGPIIVRNSHDGML